MWTFWLSHILKRNLNQSEIYSEPRLSIKKSRKTLKWITERNTSMGTILPFWQGMKSFKCNLFAIILQYNVEDLQIILTKLLMQKYLWLFICSNKVGPNERVCHLIKMQCLHKDFGSFLVLIADGISVFHLYILYIIQ